MKKIYSKPETLVTAISCCTLICESLGFAGETASEAGVTSADSRRSTVWDDDEE